VGEVIKLNCVHKGAGAVSVGVAAQDAEQAQKWIGDQPGSIGVASNGYLWLGGTLGPPPLNKGTNKGTDLLEWGEGSVIELKRASEDVYSWSKGGEEICALRHEAADEVVWGVGGGDHTIWEVVEVRARSRGVQALGLRFCSCIICARRCSRAEFAILDRAAPGAEPA